MLRVYIAPRLAGSGVTGVLYSRGVSDDDDDVPSPPALPAELLAWANAWAVVERLDDLVLASDGPVGTFLPARHGEALSYRQMLLEWDPSDSRLRSYGPMVQSVRALLHRIAILAARERRKRAFLNEHGRDPTDEALAGLLERLRAELIELRAAGTAARACGTYEPAGVRVVREPVPALRYHERYLIGADRLSGQGPDDAGVMLLGWSDGPLRWMSWRDDKPGDGDPSPERRLTALQAMIDFIRDPRQGDQDALVDVARLPVWQFALGALDDRLSRLASAASARGADAARGDERIAFRVTALRDGAVGVEAVVQKRGRNGAYSPGTRLPWYKLADHPARSAADERVFRAYDDPFARRWAVWGGPLTPAQTFGVLRALIDHPAVFFDGPGSAGRRGAERLDIRQGRLRLRFAGGRDGALTPQLELVGATLLPPEVAAVLRDDRHVVILHGRDDDDVGDGGAPRVLLAEVSPEAAAVVRALALAPVSFPPEAHDALAARLEPLQESVDVELPAHWTRTIGPADARLIARLELLASGALEVRLGVRPAKLGPVFRPGEGPALLLEGQGRDRHGVRRDRAEEQRAGRALAERLGLVAGWAGASWVDVASPAQREAAARGTAPDEEDAGSAPDVDGAETAPWCWRVGAGDPALHVVATLKELCDGEEAAVLVEWADDARLDDYGTIGRRDLRMKVADRRDWFAVEGGAKIKGARREEVVPLADLLAAIREGRRYLPVGARGFVRIEQALREALARAEAAIFEVREGGGPGTLRISGLASDPLVGLVEEESQIEAAASFRALRRRMIEGAAIVPRLGGELEAALRPYQRAGVEWLARLAHWSAGAILADEMGLGKTVQTLAVLVDRAALGPAIVVAPTSVVGNWVDEAARFAPSLRVRLYRGSDRAAELRELGAGDVLVTSYAIATLDAERLGEIEFASLVLDEAQAVKNATTERSRALRGLRAAWRVGLTGTPIENHLGEIWSLMRVISPGLLGTWEQFRGRFAVPIEKFGDDGRRRALAALLRPFILRRTKADVAPELPALTDVVRSVRLSEEEMALYEELRQSMLEEIAQTKTTPERDGQDLRFVLLAALTRMRQLCCHPRLVYPRTQAGSSKAAYLLQLLTDLREDGHKVLVFSQFRSFLELLAPRLRQHGFRALLLDGTTPAETREQRIAAFQAGEADVFLISLKAGGFGLNLTAADTVIHLDPWWNPAVEDQATARAHRIGQQRPVTAVRLVARGTIEEAVLGLHAAKRALAAGLLEGADLAATLGTDELLALIRKG
jgi:superfamily II DNA or RNA helicase